MSKQFGSNAWGDGKDIFTRVIDPESTERIRPATRGVPADGGESGYRKVTRFLGYAILFGVLLIVIAFILAAIVGIVLGFSTGISDAL